jgi:hypothetical protein
MGIARFSCGRFLSFIHLCHGCYLPRGELPMKQSRPVYVVFIVTVLLLLGVTLAPGLLMNNEVAAQGDPVGEKNAPAADTPTSQPPTVTATATEPPTATATEPIPTVPNTSTPTATEEAPEQPTSTPSPTGTPTVGPPAPPAQIPEPITVVLFGTGLAALSAAAAARRKKQE